MIPRPRLLPMTILVMTLMLGAKAVDAVQALRPSWRLPHAGLLSTAAATEAPSTSSSPSPASAHAAIAPLISDGERAILLDLRQRREQLEVREAQVATREKLLAASEHRLGTRLDELTALQGRLQALEDARRAHDEANWAGLVKTYEAMKPRDAAAIFNDLDQAVALPVIDRMKEAKAALIMAAMDPAKARSLTAALAAARLRANSVPAGNKGA